MDDDLRDLLRRLGFAICILIMFGIALVLAFLKFGGKTNTVEEKINHKEDMYLFIQKRDCSQCSTLKKALNQEMISYDVLYSNTDKRYQTILKKLSLSERDIVEPSLLYIKEGIVQSILVDIQKKDDLKDFIEYNSLSD